MILVGLTGGIGSGKSTVSALLAERGAVVVDADLVTRLVQQPGSPVLARLAERFGSNVIADDGSLDRPALAAIAFADPDALKDLNAIVHPAVRDRADGREQRVQPGRSDGGTEVPVVPREVVATLDDGASERQEAERHRGAVMGAGALAVRDPSASTGRRRSPMSGGGAGSSIGCRRSTSGQRT